MKRILLFIFIPVFCFSQGNYKQIEKSINELLAGLPSSSEYSITVYDPNLDEIVYSKNPDKPLIPASNIKLFTSAAALKLLGENYAFPTKIYTDSISTVDSVIDGNLYLKGFGNSIFTIEDLDTLVQNLAKKGIKKIKGDIIGDDKYFDNIYTRDDWIVDEKANVNLPAVSALVIDRNKMILKLFSNKNSGDLIGYEIIPACSFLETKVSAKVSGGKSRPRISTQFEENKISINVSGKMGKRKYPQSWAIFVEKPAQYSAFVLYDLLKKYGIEIEGEPLEGTTPGYSVELESSSVPLLKILYELNKDSDNYLAECLFKSLGAFFSEQQGNSFYATQAVLTFASDIGIDITNLSIVDGSGISRFNALTSGSIAELLTYIYFDEDLFKNFFPTLSIAGNDGTLKDRMSGTYAEDNFRGKTGTLNGVCSISGYLSTKNNSDLIVSILMEFKQNGANYYRDIQDKIISIIAERL